MINRSQLNFHETFQPEANYITSILELAAENYLGTKFQISEMTGIPTGAHKGKVLPSLKYAAYMGLIRYTYDKGSGCYLLNLTELGNEIFAQDKYLQEELTKWICHYNLSRPEKGAAQWAYIVHRAHCGFLQSVSSELLLQKANQEFGVKIPFKEMFSVVKLSYTEGVFAPLHFVEWTDKLEFEEHIESPELVYAYGYALLNSWDDMFPEKEEITMNEVVEKIGIGRVFGFPPDEINCVLDSLANEGVIAINRQLFPATILRIAKTDEMISNLYSRLL